MEILNKMEELYPKKLSFSGHYYAEFLEERKDFESMKMPSIKRILFFKEEDFLCSSWICD